jgi:hypothetical protein
VCCVWLCVDVGVGSVGCVCVCVCVRLLWLVVVLFKGQGEGGRLGLQTRWRDVELTSSTQTIPMLPRTQGGGIWC